MKQNNFTRTKSEAFLDSLCSSGLFKKSDLKPNIVRFNNAAASKSATTAMHRKTEINDNLKITNKPVPAYYKKGQAFYKRMQELSTSSDSEAESSTSYTDSEEAESSSSDEEVECILSTDSSRSAIDDTKLAGDDFDHLNI